MEESHTKEQSPKQFGEWCFEQGDRKCHQDELELVFELGSDFLGRKKKGMGAGISGGGPRGAHEAGGRALDPRGQVLAPLAVCSVPYFLKYSRKNHISFSWHLENFYFRDIFYCTDKSGNRQKILFFFYLS